MLCIRIDRDQLQLFCVLANSNSGGGNDTPTLMAMAVLVLVVSWPSNMAGWSYYYGGSTIIGSSIPSNSTKPCPSCSW